MILNEFMTISYKLVEHHLFINSKPDVASAKCFMKHIVLIFEVILVLFIKRLGDLI